MSNKIKSSKSSLTGHCERPKGARQSPVLATLYEIASVVILPRTDIMTQPRRGEGIILVYLFLFIQHSMLNVRSFFPESCILYRVSCVLYKATRNKVRESPLFLAYNHCYKILVFLFPPLVDIKIIANGTRSVVSRCTMNPPGRVGCHTGLVEVLNGCTII